MAKTPNAVDQWLAECRSKGMEISEGKTAALPEIGPQRREQLLVLVDKLIAPAMRLLANEAICEPKPRKAKYGNRKTEVDGIVFDSRKEARRYVVLKGLQAAGAISDLELQPKWDIFVGGMKICRYIADFGYYIAGRPDRVIEDCKGMKTPAYRMKAKLMKAVFEISILET